MVLTVIVTYNGSKWIEKCISSLLNSSTVTDILVIDNLSNDNTLEIISNNFRSIELLKLNENIGFGKANNIGLKKFLRYKYEYVFLLNQDAWVETNTIGELIEIQKKNTNYGILSPFQISGDCRKIDNNFSKYILTEISSDLISDLFFGRPLKEVYEASFINAAIWLISRDCIERVGGFDPLFKQYGEDNDYAKRALINGYKIGVCPKILGYHDRPQTIDVKQYWDKNRILGNRLLKLKDPNNPLPSKMKVQLIYLKSLLSSLVINNEKFIRQRDLSRFILNNYSEIKLHRESIFDVGPSFLID